MVNLTKDYLESNGFQLENFTDGSFYVKYYHPDYFLQVELPIGTGFTEYSDGWVEDLTEKEFIDTIEERKSNH